LRKLPKPLNITSLLRQASQTGFFPHGEHKMPTRAEYWRDQMRAATPGAVAIAAVFAVSFLTAMAVITATTRDCIYQGSLPLVF
jgi:hypothetical protein